MEDPVKLPVSEIVIDRINILKCLINEKCDPFTRLPLTEA